MKLTDPIRGTLLADVYGLAIETPLHLAAQLSQFTGNQIYLKREDMQPVHSFKIRGAYNKISKLTKDQLAQGVIAASAGNHAQGVAMSAAHFGAKASIVMPRTTPQIKIDSVRQHGAEVILSGDNYSEAYAACMEILKSSSQTFIHPFDDADVIYGQGTVGREILEQLPDADYIFVPIGGGGLAAGIAQYAANLNKTVKIIGVEPDDSNAMQQSLRANKRIIMEHVGIFADGVAVKQVGALTYKICKKYLSSVITVDNDQICAAIKRTFEDTRSIVEPAGALGLAGALKYASQHNLQDKNIVVICSGANMAFERLQFVAERTLLGSDQEALFEVRLHEKPGALNNFCNEVVNGHNITEFSYRKSDRKGAHIFVGISIKDSSDKSRFVDKMHAHGYDFHDLSQHDIAKEHIRHMIGGAGRYTEHEHIFEINFPERPRALAEFLQKLGGDTNISLFHYRGQGGDTGKVLIGFEAPDALKLDAQLAGTGYEYTLVTSKAAHVFLS